MNNTRYEDFCNRMRVYRKRLGYNQADIGKELGISQNDYSKRENGLIMISYDNLKKLQEIGMDIDELVSGKRDDIDTKDLDELISDCESEELKDMTMRMVAECIKYYRVNDTKNKDNDTQNDRMFDFMLKQWDDFSMLEYVRHETHYSQEVMSEKLGLTRKKYRKYEKEIMYPDADTLVQMYTLPQILPYYLQELLSYLPSNNVWKLLWSLSHTPLMLLHQKGFYLYCHHNIAVLFSYFFFLLTLIIITHKFTL